VDDVAISVNDLGKIYRIAHQRDRYGRLTESLSGAFRKPIDLIRRKPRETTEWIWALRDVSFDLRQGDVVGVIGRNGAGKTTLLKVLSRITEPTTGRATLRGRVGSLLEVGTGFHPELTGRENVFMSGAVLGMRRTEINRKFDEIVDFAGIEQFLDTPVKRYSSGMQVRLGFAVAAHLETEILIVDEVLAVGDAEFQRKCLAKIGDVSHEGKTVLFVSHNMAAIETQCSSALLLDGGRIVGRGTAAEVVDRYVGQSGLPAHTAVGDRTDRGGDGRLRIVGIEASVRTGTASEIRLRYRAAPGLHNLAVLVGLYTLRGEAVAWLSTEMAGAMFGEIPAEGTIVCDLGRASLVPGRYTMNVHCAVSGAVADYIVDAAAIDVSEGDYFGTGKLPLPGNGFTAISQAWSIEPAESRSAPVEHSGREST
jgi:lipopolysaccharide transport system ATP-binding protein